MKELHIDKFDALLSLAAAECVKEDAADFLSADISGIEDNPKMLRKLLGVSRKTKWKAVQIIALVALLCMSIAFTACMLVPEIRNAVWNVLVKGHGDHIEIGFESGEETEAVTEPPVTDYPETIERKMELTYLPEGCVKGEEISMALQYQILYYTNEGDYIFNITQSVISRANSFVDNKENQIAQLNINQHKAILIENDGSELTYSLIWQDEQYRYTIDGSFTSISVLVEIAKGVILAE